MVWGDVDPQTILTPVSIRSKGLEFLVVNITRCSIKLIC